MKNSQALIIILFALSFMSCKAQITPLFNANPDLIEGAYYKDIDNDLDKFVGTWKWEDDNNNSLTIILEKREHVYDGEYYNDLIVGEYKYVESGLEIVNTLSNLLTNNSNNIELSALIDNSYPQCNECNPNERRINALFIDPNRRYIVSGIIIRHSLNNSIESLDILIFGKGTVILPEENSPTNIRVPLGEYVLVKQD